MSTKTRRAKTRNRQQHSVCAHTYAQPTQLTLLERRLQPTTLLTPGRKALPRTALYTPGSKS